MTGLVYLHVGPPKTGTTSLQLALQEAELPGFTYIGTHQPRSDYPEDRIKLLSQLARGDELTPAESVELQETFTTALGAGKALIVSEEMLVVDKSEAAIRARLRRAINYFRQELGLSVRLILTLRDPVDAIPSYYQEIFRSLPGDMTSEFSAFARDGRAFCYDYAALMDHAHACGAETHVVEFTQLASGKVPMTALLGADCGTDAVLDLGKANTGNKTGSGRVLPAITLAQRLRYSRLHQLLHRAGMNRLPGWHILTSGVRKISVKPERIQELILPSDVLSHYTRSLVQAREKSGDSKKRGL
ncbi:hypothetical protein [Paracoccus sp. SJTW-4]|uniref:hypothetical protein n=1 Tax=Paracoccus sp. SJTW-4 TaxID=3078428 RepID=UPI0039ED675F